MPNKVKKTHFKIALTIVISAVVMRLVPHIPNFAPMTAAALFGAAYLPKRYALIVPLAAMAISDYLLLYISPFSQPIFNFSHIQPISAMFTGTNGTTPWIWASFMLSGLLGLALRKNPSALRIGTVTVAASAQFFLITNFAVWAGGAYARDISGLWASYVAALPFLRWTMLGDMFYTVTFFALYAYVTKQAEAGDKRPAANLQTSI